MSAPTVISLFAGCGGSSLGYKWAGYDERLAVEWDNNAAEAFALNFPEVDLYHGDVANLSVTECLERARLTPGELDVLDGSPPCQGFSTAGKRDVSDPRNQLFKEYIRLLVGLKPRVLVMENVSGMVKGPMKFIFVQILREIEEAGYRVRARLMNTKYFGVPQSRPRLIFIGVRADLDLMPTHPKGFSSPISLRAALKDVPGGLCQGLFTGKRLELARNIKAWSDGSKVIKGHSFNLKRLDWGRPSRTVLKSIGRANSHYGGGLIHPDEHRHLTIPELKRVGSFPDDFQLVGTFENQWERVGNSVPPRFMEAIARHIKDNILGELTPEPNKKD